MNSTSTSALLAFTLLTTATAQAATLYVTDLGDSGPGTLREAVTTAAPGDNIVINVSGTISLLTQLSISNDLKIHSGMNVSVSVEPANYGYRLIEIVSGNVLLGGFTVANAFNNEYSGVGSYGGGLYVTGGARASLNRMTFRSNAAYYGGAVYNDGTVTIINSTFSNNTGLDPGIGCDGGGYGAAIANEGQLVIRNTTFANNHSDCATALFQSSSAATAIVANTLFTNQDGNGASGAFGGYCWILGGTLLSLGHNLVDDEPFFIAGDNCNLAAPGDLLVPDPLIGPLGNYGGTTQTHSLLVGSPAIDAGDDLLAPSIDQRGMARPSGEVSDIGAFEFY